MSDQVNTFPLEPTEEQMRAMIEGAARAVIDHVTSLGAAPAVALEGADLLAKTFREPPPEGPGDFDDLLGRAVDALRTSFNTAGPGYLAFIPGGGLFTSALAEWISLSFNRYAALWFPSPALAQMEATTIRWLCDIVGYPESARGILTSGGSTANLSAIVAARHSVLGEDFSDGVIYLSPHTHASVAKGATVAGFPSASLRTVATDDRLRIDVVALQAAIDDDRAAGRRPALVVASAGTTDTGAIDPLESIGALARREGIWLHADGAYGGAFAMTERGGRRLTGLSEADSITLDPHKTMFLPYGTGALLVRDGEHLRASHSPPGPSHYLADLTADDDAINLADYSTELSREARGLRLWLPIMLHGMNAFRDALDEKLDLTDRLHRGLLGIDGVEVPWEPQLTVVAFRVRDSDPARADARTKALMERINGSKRVFVSSTSIGDRFTIRACIVSHRTHADRIDETIQIVRRALEQV